MDHLDFASFAKTVLYEDNHLLVVNKPAPLATMGALAGKPSLVDAAKAYLKRRYDKPGNVYLGIVSRLDQMVTGVIVLARTSKAAARLSRQFDQREVVKIYWALVQPPAVPSKQECIDWLIKNDALHRMQVVHGQRPGAKQARLAYRTLSQSHGMAWLEIRLDTGRKHQIRAQLADRGWPVLGDRKYGSKRPFVRGIALHCRLVQLQHPVQHRPLQLIADPPEYWPDWAVP